MRSRDSQPHHDLPDAVAQRGDDTGAIQAPSMAAPPTRWSSSTPARSTSTGNGLSFRTSDCTLRGSGTGTPGRGAGGTRSSRRTGPPIRSYAILYVGYDPSQFSSSIIWRSDAVKGSNPHAGEQSRDPGRRDRPHRHNTNNDPQVFWGPNHDGPAMARALFRSSGSIANQMME